MATESVQKRCETQGCNRLMASYDNHDSCLACLNPKHDMYSCSICKTFPLDLFRARRRAMDYKIYHPQTGEEWVPLLVQHSMLWSDGFDPDQPYPSQRNFLIKLSLRESHLLNRGHHCPRSLNLLLNRVMKRRMMILRAWK